MAQPIPFLELPAEIRNMCYSYMTPINGRPEEYSGLFLACKQVHIEMDGECVKHMRHLIDALEAKWAAFESKQKSTDKILRPQSFAQMQHFTLNFPRRSNGNYIDTYIRSTNLVPYLRQILQLHLQSLILECYDLELHRSIPWQLTYGMWRTWGSGRTMARLQNGEKIGAREVVIELDSVLTARGRGLVESFAGGVDPRVVSRMGVSPDLKGVRIEIQHQDK
jgi:hypothetical protein